jgi:magnesium chelatase subunit D
MISPTRFPFSAVVGVDDARLALLLAAIDPGIGGVLLRGDRGSAKSTLARGLAGLLPGGAPFVELPLGATEDRVLGTLDVQVSPADGTSRFRPGLLQAAHGGVLYVDEVNLLPDPLVNVLLDVAASGVNRVERNGISHAHPARFVLVGSMNPQEGELRPQLLDRFGLSVAVSAPSDPRHRAEVVRRRLTHDAGGRVAGVESDIVLRARLAASLPADLPDTVVDFACRLAVGVGAEGLRADLVLCRAAAAFAGWEGRSIATAADVERVAAVTLGHRRRRRAFDPPTLSADELERALESARQSFAGADAAAAPPREPATPAPAPTFAPEDEAPGRASAGGDGADAETEAETEAAPVGTTGDDTEEAHPRTEDRAGDPAIPAAWHATDDAAPVTAGDSPTEPDAAGDDDPTEAATADDDATEPDAAGDDAPAEPGTGGDHGPTEPEAAGDDDPAPEVAGDDDPAPEVAGDDDPAAPEVAGDDGVTEPEVAGDAEDAFTEGDTPSPTWPAGTYLAPIEDAGAVSVTPGPPPGPPPPPPPPPAAPTAAWTGPPGVLTDAPAAVQLAEPPPALATAAPREELVTRIGTATGTTVAPSVPPPRSAPRPPVASWPPASATTRTAHGSDAREPARTRTAGRTVVVAVDASGSSGTHRRVEAATGLVLGLLADAYLRRDRVALVTFRGATADVVLPPTASVELARNRLAELPTGGVTPLAEGIGAGLSLAEQAQADGWPPLLVLISDGRATGSGDALERARRAACEVAAAGVDAVLIDAEQGTRRRGLALELASDLGARYVRVEELNASCVEAAIRDALRDALRDARR